MEFDLVLIRICATFWVRRYHFVKCGSEVSGDAVFFPFFKEFLVAVSESCGGVSLGERLGYRLEIEPRI